MDKDREPNMPAYSGCVDVVIALKLVLNSGASQSGVLVSEPEPVLNCDAYLSPHHA